MHKQMVRTVVGLSVILVHLFALAMIMFFKTEYTSPSQRLDFAFLLLPVTATYVVAVVKSAVDNQADFDPGKPVNFNYVMVVFLITGALLAGIAILVVQTPSPLVPTIEEAKRWLVAFEIGLGGSFGYIASDLFGKIEKVTVPQKPPGT